MGLSLADIGAPALALFDLARCVFRLPLLPPSAEHPWMIAVTTLFAAFYTHRWTLHFASEPPSQPS